jgi:curved DNA-binding protein CbpA
MLDVSHYSVLGVVRDADANAITAAYKAKILLLSRPGFLGALRRVYAADRSRLQLAMVTLLDPVLRTAHDAEVARDLWTVYPPY